MRTYLLHGFLGRPSDWDGLVPTSECIAVDLFADPIGPDDSPAAWAKRFVARVAAEGAGPAMLVGYSLGARLALHALAVKPALWKRAVLVSCHPGLDSEAERAARIADDDLWAKRFLADPWDEVIAAWESRPVFGGTAPPAKRRETDFRRERLATALRRWSLGRQENFFSALPSLSVPKLWIAGKKDAKFTELAVTAAKASGDRCVIAEGAGHRVPWERPEIFRGIFRGILS